MRRRPHRRPAVRPTPIARLLGLVVAASLVAAACGGGDDNSSDEADSGESTNSVTDAAADGSTAEADDDGADGAGTEAADDGAETEEATRVVATDFGDFEVPADPQRVLILDPVVALPTVLDLGVPVIGTLSTTEGRPPASMVTEDEWGALEVLGTTNAASVEAVAAAEPDLILLQPNSEEEFLLLAEVAPAVPIVLSNRWQDDARQVAEAVGRSDEMEQRLADYQARADEVGAAIDEAVGDPTVVILRIRADQIRVHTSVHFAGNILSDVGMRMPEEWVREPLEDPVANLQQRIERISLEQLGLLATADHIIVLVAGTPSQSADEVAAAVDDVLESALWATLPAVQNDNVHLADAHWLSGSERAAALAVEDVLGFMTAG